jgi:hypothetical protein
MPDNEPQDFGAVFLNHAKGRAHDEASKLLKEAVEAVRRTGKNATVTVKLTVKPVANIPNAYKLSDAVSATIPEDPRTSMWFADDDGALHRNDPNQGSLYDETEVRDGKTASAGHDN